METLHSLPWLAAGDGSAQVRLPGRRRSFVRGEDIWTEGDLASTLFFLESGQATIVRGATEDHEVTIRTVRPGEPLGELCFCLGSGGVRPTTARADTPVVALEVGLDSLINTLLTNRGALVDFIVNLCDHQAELEQRIEVLAYRGADDRLGRLLLHLVRYSGQPLSEAGAHCTLCLSHEELAHMAAMSRPHLTVTMGRFRALGLVRYSRKAPIVVDVPALRKYLSRNAG